MDILQNDVHYGKMLSTYTIDKCVQNGIYEDLILMLLKDYYDDKQMTHQDKEYIVDFLLCSIKRSYRVRQLLEGTPMFQLCKEKGNKLRIYI